MLIRKHTDTKFIVITGGVISGIGKGVTTASIGRLFSSRYNVLPIKCDGYLNTDPGTINPIEHGEVYILDDGGEVDMDFGHYERFLNIETKSKLNITMGKIYKTILDNEREGLYLGKTVQLIPHVTNEIKNRIYNIAEEEEADIVIIEVGGTVGDLENALFIEAVRQMRLELGQENIIFTHLTYIPKPAGINEQKSKPTQLSIKALNELGVYPDVVIARCSEELNETIYEKLSLYGNIKRDHIVTSPDVETIYAIPQIFKNQRLDEIIAEHLKLKTTKDLGIFKDITTIYEALEKTEPLQIAICGKYTDLEDSYASIAEALKHTEFSLRVKILVHLKNLDGLPYEEVQKELQNFDAIIVPGGFGSRGIEGKINAIRYARENNVPFLGICYGMQLAVVEYARNVCHIEGANTVEAEEDGFFVKNPVIDLLEEQKHVYKKGGSMRLGGHEVFIKPATVAHKIFNSDKIRARFRHRYEVNPLYVPILEEKGICFSGASGEGIKQIMEIGNHVFFVGCQFHPEITSKPEEPSLLFKKLIENAIKNKRRK